MLFVLMELKKESGHIGSVAYLVIFYVLLSFYLALVLSCTDSNISAIFPIWGPGKLEIAKEGA